MSALSISYRMAGVCLGLITLAVVALGSSYPEVEDIPRPIWTFTVLAYAVVLLLPPTLLVRVQAIGLGALVARTLGMLGLLWSVGTLSVEAAEIGEFLTPLVLVFWGFTLMAGLAVIEISRAVFPSRNRSELDAAQPPVAADAP